jgi:hypothetical protein
MGSSHDPELTPNRVPSPIFKRPACTNQPWPMWVATFSALMLTLTGLAKPMRKESVRWRLPPYSKDWNLSVGSGAEYDATCPGERTVVDVAIIGKQAVGTQVGYWLEVSSHFPGSQRIFASDTLFYLERDKIVFVRGVGQVPGLAPMELPTGWLFGWARGSAAVAYGYVSPYSTASWLTPQGGSNSTHVSPAWAWGEGGAYPGVFGGFSGEGLPATAKELSLATVTTPAGTFTTRTWRTKGGVGSRARPVYTWTAKGAGPFGVVKASLQAPRNSAESWGMVLTRVLPNATSRMLAQPLPANPDLLWHTIWKSWRDHKPALCLPQIGTFQGGPPG